MRDDHMGCQTMRCPQYARKLSLRKGYWCCQGCDEADCIDRCHNDRDSCNVATYSSRQEDTETGTRWTKTELNILKAGYSHMTVIEMRQMLPRKTEAAIYKKAERLGLFRHNEVK